MTTLLITLAAVYIGVWLALTYLLWSVEVQVMSAALYSAAWPLLAAVTFIDRAKEDR